MKLEQSFEVDAPLERVWTTLIDVEHVAPCLPGADIKGADGDGVYRGTFSVKIGPATAAYDGTLTIEQADEATHTVTMRANGQDKRGQGTAKATIESRVTDGGGKTRVDVTTDFTITGRLARIGRGGVMQDIANRLLGDFARCLESRISESGGSAPAAPSTAESGETDAARTEAALDAVAESAAEQPTQASPEETGTLAPANEPTNARSEPAAPEAPMQPAMPTRRGTSEPPQPTASPAPQESAEPQQAAAPQAESGSPQPAPPAASEPQQPAAPQAASEPPQPAAAPQAASEPQQPAAAPAPRTATGSPQPAAPVRGVSLLLSVLWRRIERFLRRLLGRDRAST